MLQTKEKVSLKVSNKIMRIFLIIVGSALVIETIYASFYSVFNLGLILPLLIGLPLLAWGIFYPNLFVYYQNGIGRVIKYIVVALYLIFIIGFFVFLFFSIRAQTKQVDEDADVIIVLGAGLRGERVSKLLALRLDKAYEYYQEHPDTILVVSGGQGAYEIRSEASAMRDYLLDLGVPNESIMMEDQSTSTYENFAYSKELLDKRFGVNGYKAIFSTSGFHVLRSTKIAKNAGLPIEGLSASYSTKLVLNNYLREYVAFVYHGLLGDMR